MPLRVKLYKLRQTRLGRVAIEVLELEREETVSGQLIDIVAEYEERYRNTPGVLVEITEEDQKTGAEKLVAGFTTIKAPILFPRPARLERVLVIDRETAAKPVPTPLTSLPSYRPAGTVYVYAGRIGVDGGAWGVVLETDKGWRLVRLESGMKKDSNSD